MRFLLDNYPTLSAVLAVLIVLFSTIKYLVSLVLEKRKVKLKYLEISNAVMAENISRPNKKQKYLTEQIFEHRYRCQLTYDDVKTLINAPYSDKAFKFFSKAWRYVKLTDSKKSYAILDKYEGHLLLYGKKYYYVSFKLLIQYVSLIVLAMFALGLSVFIFNEAERVFIKYLFSFALTFTACMFFIMAFHCLWESDKIKDAERLVKEFGHK